MFGQQFNSKLRAKDSDENAVKYCDLQYMTTSEICKTVSKKAYCGCGGRFVEMSIKHYANIKDERVSAAGERDINRCKKLPNMEIKTGGGNCSNFGNGEKTLVLYIPVITWEFTDDGYLNMDTQEGFVIPIRDFKRIFRENGLFNENEYIKTFYRLSEMRPGDCQNQYDKLFDTLYEAVENGYGECLSDFLERL